MSQFFRRIFLGSLSLCAGALAAAEGAPRMLLLDGTVTGYTTIAVGERGTILRSTDLARTWQTVSVPTSATLTGVSFSSDTLHGWAVGHDATILATTDGGLTWQKQWQGENLSDSFLNVLALDDNHVIAIGAFGLYVSTDDGGRTWTKRRIRDEDYHLNRITHGPSGTLYIAGEHGTLLRSTDRGASWIAIDSPYDGSFYGILPLGPRDLFAYGLRGRLYLSGDDGETWQRVENDQRVLLATAAQVAAGTIIVAGQAGSFLVSHDRGDTVVSWRPVLKTGVAELLILPDDTLLALGEAGATILPKP